MSQAVQISFRWAGGEEDAPASGFRFGNCLICVAPPERNVFAARFLTVFGHDGARTLQAHTRLVPFELERTELDCPQVLAMLLDEAEEALLPDLATRFTLFAPIGARVRVTVPNPERRMVVIGEIVERERALGNFRYFVVIQNARLMQGHPVFLDDDNSLVGIVVGTGPGYATVLGVEPAANPSKLIEHHEGGKRRARTLQDVLDTLLPDRYSTPPRSIFDSSTEEFLR